MLFVRINFEYKRLRFSPNVLLSNWLLEELPTATHKCVSLFWRIFLAHFTIVQKGHHT